MSTAATEIRRLSTCSFEDAVRIWNEGFQGYFVDMTMSLDRYLSRLHSESLSPELSLVAFADQRPVGFLLNGVRQNGDLKVAWNGGTGVAPDFRGRGIGKLLMKATLELYDELGVDVAQLEAISTNTPAIVLYQKCGFEVVDRLIFLTHDGRLADNAFSHADSYSASSVAPYVVGQLDFYDRLPPWQSDWQSLARNNGEALIVNDASGDAVGYALFKKTYDERGSVREIVLHQCVAKRERDADAIIACALRSAFAPLDLECRRKTYNLIIPNVNVSGMFRDEGFHPFIEQVHMVRRFKR